MKVETNRTDGGRNALFELMLLTLRIFRNRLRLDPHVAPMLARQISDAFHATISTGKDDGSDPRLAILMIHRLLMELPKAIQDLLSADSSLKDILQLESVSSVVIDHVRFESDLLWNAIAKCIASGAEEKVLSLLPAEEWIIKSMDKNVTISSAERQLAISDSVFQVLAADEETRRKFLQNISTTFDLSAQDIDLTIDGIATSPSYAEFMNRLAEARLHSLEFKAATLAEQILKGAMEVDSAINSDDEDILHYLRLASVDVESQHSYQDAGAVLLKERGIDEAILRYALLPIPLPETIANTWHQQTKLARKQSADHLRSACKSSIEKMHLRRLFAASDFVGRGKFLKALDRELLTARDGSDIEAQLSVVEWVRRALIVKSKNSGKNQSGAALLLSAWTFGGLLYRHLQIRKIAPKAISEFFDRLADPTLRILFGRGDSHAGNPRHQPSDYVAHIFAYAYEDNTWPLTASVKAGWREYFAIGKLPAAFPRAGIRSWAQPADLCFTMMANDIRPTLRSQLPEIAGLYGDENRSELLTAVLGRLTRDQSDGLMWAFVPMLADLISTEQFDELRRLLGEINLAQLMVSGDGRKTALIAFGTPRILESGELRAKLRALLISTASELSAEAQSGARGLISVEDRERVALLQECAMRIAIASDNSERLQAEAYVALAREMGARWPKIFQVLAPHVVEYSKTLPLEQSAPFGMLILDCRRTA
jgi:hypothetical protein